MNPTKDISNKVNLLEDRISDTITIKYSTRDAFLIS